MGEGGTEALGGSRRGAQPVEAEEGRPDHRRGGDLHDPGRRGQLRDLRADLLPEGRGVAVEQAAAQDHVDVQAGQAEPADGRPGHGHHLGHLPGDDPGRDRVAGLGLGEHQRDQLQHPPPFDPAQEQRLDQGQGAALAEPAGDQAGQGRRLPAAVLAAQGGADGGHAEVAAAAPVPRQLPDGREAHLAAVGGDPDAVHAGADHHPDPPGAVAPGPPDREHVVVQQRLAGPAPSGDRRPQGLVVGREVEAGQAPDPDLGQRAPAGRDAGVLAGRRDQRLQSLHGRRDTQVVVGGPGPAGRPEHPAGGVDQGHLGLGVAPVDGEHRRRGRVSKLS